MRSKRGNAVIIVVVILALFFAGVASFLYFQNQQLKKQTVISELFPDLPTLTPEQGTDVISNPTLSPQAVSTTPNSKACEPVIVYEAAGAIPQSDKDQIQEKVVNPFNDYYCDLEGPGYLVSLSIGKNTGASQEQYPYSAKAIYKNGATAGFLINKIAGSIDWWLPDCLGPCPFSESFKAKYPEIVAKSP